MSKKKLPVRGFSPWRRCLRPSAWSTSASSRGSSSGFQGLQSTQSQQIVGSSGESSSELRPFEASDPTSFYSAEALEPAEDGLDSAPDDLAGSMASMPKGALVDRRFPSGAVDIRRDLRRDAGSAARLHKVRRVVAIVSAHRLAPSSANSRHERRTLAPLSESVCLAEQDVHQETVAILHQHVTHVRQLRLAARPLTGQPRFRISHRSMRFIAALFAAKVVPSIRVTTGRTVLRAEVHRGGISFQLTSRSPRPLARTPETASSCLPILSTAVGCFRDPPARGRRFTRVSHRILC